MLVSVPRILQLLAFGKCSFLLGASHARIYRSTVSDHIIQWKVKIDQLQKQQHKEKKNHVCKQKNTSISF